MSSYYVIRFAIPDGGRLFAGYSHKSENKQGTWGFASEFLTARRFKTAALAKKVAQNAPPYKQVAAEGCKWTIMKITEEVIESAA